MTHYYLPEPYDTIINRLGNAYDSGFFMEGACLCLAVILSEAAEKNGHPATIQLVLEDGLFLHHAFIEITVDGTVYDIDIKRGNARNRALKALENQVNAEPCRDRQPTESTLEYLVSLTQQYGVDYHLEDIAGGKDSSKSFSFIRNLAFDYA